MAIIKLSDPKCEIIQDFWPCPDYAGCYGSCYSIFC